jgi:hypothetical protein
VEEVDEKDHATNLFTREAIQVIHDHAEHHSQDPFFM